MTTIAAAPRVNGTVPQPADVTTPAVVLKFDPNVMHHGALGAIRSLGRLGVPVYAVQESAWAPAGQSRYLCGKILWRPEGLAADRVQAGLLRLADLIGTSSVLIPTDDAAAIFLAEHGECLRGRFLFPAQPAGLPRQVAGKHSLHVLCAEVGVPSPRSFLTSSLEQAAQIAADYGYPVVAKLARPWQSRRGQLSTRIVDNRTELDEVWRTTASGGAGLMLQEYIPAAAGHDWFFHGYAGSGGECWPACTGIKDRSYPVQAGLTSFGRCMPNAPLREAATGLLGRLGYRGIADLDFRLDDRDGQYKLLDFNPRLGAQFRLFTGTTGLDVARAAYLDLTGQPVTGTGPVAGRTFMVENYDPLSAVSRWRRRELGLRSWLAAALSVDETAWFARDDLLPFEVMCLRMGWRMLTRPAARAIAVRARPTADRDGPATRPRLHRGRSTAARVASLRVG